MSCFYDNLKKKKFALFFVKKFVKGSRVRFYMSAIQIIFVFSYLIYLFNSNEIQIIKLKIEQTDMRKIKYKHNLKKRKVCDLVINKIKSVKYNEKCHIINYQQIQCMHRNKKHNVIITYYKEAIIINIPTHCTGNSPPVIYDVISQLEHCLIE